jgi:chromate reductase
MWCDKPVFLMATSPGKRGGSSVLEHANNIFPYRGAVVASSYSLPSFNDNFKEGIANKEESTKFHESLDRFTQVLNA